MYEKLIELVRKYTVLYDTNDPEYLKSKLKTEIWNNIARNINLKHGKHLREFNNK